MPQVTPGELAPPWFRLFTLLVVILLSTMVGMGLAYAIMSATGLDNRAVLDQIASGNFENLRTLRWVLLINQLFSFALPAIVTAWYLHRSQWLQKLHLARIPASRWLLFGLIFTLLALPVAQFLLAIGQQLPLPDWASQLEDRTSGLIAGMLQVDGIGSFILTLFIMAILPAVGEELVFRGLVQRNLERWFNGKGVLAIWVTAAIFSAIHFQFEGFFSRMVLGAVMGYLYFWTRNLWVSIFAHFLNNALFVVIAYSGGDLISAQLDELQNAPAAIPWTTGLLFGGLLLAFGMYLHRLAKEN